MKHSFLYIFIFIFISDLYPAPHVTRNYSYRHFDIRDGLAQMQVMCAFQDADGYLWFGSKNGLSRFDGNRFISYKRQDGVPQGDIFYIAQWKNDIFFMTRNTISWFSPGHPIKTVPLPKNDVIYDNNVIFFYGDKVYFFDVYEQKRTSFYKTLEYNRRTNRFRQLKSRNEEILYLDGNLLLGAENIYSFNPVTGEVALSTRKMPQKSVRICKDRDSVFYFYYNDKISTYRLKNNQWIRINEYDDYKHIWYDIKLDYARSSLSLLTNKGMPVVIHKKGTTEMFEPNMGIINGVIFDKEDNLWVYGENGINYFSQLNFQEYRLGLSKNDAIWSIIQDKEGCMYFGSYGNGLWKMNKRNELMELKTDFPVWNCQYFCSSKSAEGKLFFPYADGVGIYKNGKMTKISGTHGSLCTYVDKKTDIFYAGFKDSTGNQHLLVKKRENIRFYPWSKSYIVSMTADSKGKIRIGAFKSEGIFDGDSLRVIPVEKNSADSGAISLAVDTLGRIWKGRLSGLYYEDVNGKNHRFLEDRVKGIVTSVLIYRNKYLLVGGEKSIFIVDIYHNKSIPNDVREFGYEEGFTGLESGQNGFCIDDSGDVWLAASECMIKFNPDHLLKSSNLKLPRLRVSALFASKNNINWQIHDLSFPVLGIVNEEIEIDNANKFLRFEYIANSISAPRSLRFKYRLKGFSDEWSQPVYTKTAEFTNLGFGKYQFEVQCSLDGVNWSPVVRSPLIHILTPFLLRWYMWALYALLFALSIIGITLYFSKRREKKRYESLTRQKLENELQLRTLHSKVLPHFTKNVLTAIGHFAMEDKRRAGHYISVFSKFTQLTLNNSDKNYNTLESELNYIKAYLELEKMRFGERFDYSINLENDVNTEILVPAMALHTYCDNAIRHGLVNYAGNGKLTVEIKHAGTGTLIQITDNGIGRKRSEELGTRGNRQGLTLVQQQFDFYNKMNDAKISQNIIDLQDDKESATGTKVELFIPDGYKFSS